MTRLERFRGFFVIWPLVGIDLYDNDGLMTGRPHYFAHSVDVIIIMCFLYRTEEDEEKLDRVK